MADEIVTTAEVAEWLRLDDEEPMLDTIIQIAYDMSEGCVDDFTEKLKSAKFKRKLKLFMLNTIVSMYDSRGFEDDGNKMQFVNATMLLQLNYGTYSEDDT